MKKLLILFTILIISGCTFYRHDVDTEYSAITKKNEVVRDSKTYWSFLKNVHLGLDGLTLNSEVEDFKVALPISGIPIGLEVGNNE